MPRRLALLIAALLVAACAPQRAEPGCVGCAAPDPDAGTDDPRTATPDPGALTWDSHRGWEVPRPLPPGQLTGKRDPALFLNVGHAPAGEPALMETLVGRPPGLADRSLIVPHERLCDPTLARAVGRLAPERLLIYLEGDPSDAEWACLEDLGEAPLYLTACANDAYPTLYGCDGDAQLDALAARPDLRARVRGLATSFERPAHWATLATFPHLERLLVRGPALDGGLTVERAQAICELPDLAMVDVFDAEHVGHDAHLPLHCVLGLQTYRDVSLGFDAMFRAGTWGQKAAPPPCALKRLELFSLSETAEAQLTGWCEGLVVDTVDKAEERYRKAREGIGKRP